MLPDASGVIEKIKRASLEAQEASKPVNIGLGKVTAKFPLQISTEQKMQLKEGQLILTRNVTDFMASIDGKMVTVKNGLNVGDEVILVRQQKGQKFIVIDRIGGR